MPLDHGSLSSMWDRGRDRRGHGVVTPLLGTAKQADELIAAEHAQHEPGRVTLRDVSTT
jgi:hypothetical protein